MSVNSSGRGAVGRKSVGGPFFLESVADRLPPGKCTRDEWIKEAQALPPIGGVPYLDYVCKQIAGNRPPKPLNGKEHIFTCKAGHLEALRDQ